MGILVEFSVLIAMIHTSIMILSLGSDAAPVEVGNTSLTEDNTYGNSPFFNGPRTTLTDLGEMTMHMLSILSTSGKESMINIQGLSDLVAVLAKNALMLDNPTEAYKALIQQEAIDKMKTDIQEKLTTLKSKEEELTSKMAAMETEFTTKLEDFINKQKQMESCDVYISTNLSVSQGDIVKFNGVTQNEGVHYNTATGVFSCPVTGYYLISLTLQGQTIQTSVRVKVDGKEVAMILSGDCQFDIRANYGRYRYNLCKQTNSVSKVVLCSVGEAIFVEAASSGNLVEPLNDVPQNQFSVYLVQRMD